MKRLSRLSSIIAAIALGATALAGTARAQVPPDLAEAMRKLGQVVDPACTARLYRPLMPANDINSKVTPLYPGYTVVRNVSFGPHVKDVVDIIHADTGPGNRTVLIYVTGGAGNKIEIQDRAANAFYDNIGRWASDNGMTYVNMQRHPGKEWDDPAKDVAAMIQWLQANIAKYHGNPDRMFIWAQSAGNGPVGTYIGHPELHGPKGVGLKGAILMSGQFNILPVQPASTGGPGGFGNAGIQCGAGVPNSDAGALPGAAPGTPGGPYTPEETASRTGGAPPVDPATQLARSNLPGLKASPVKLFLATAELDPGIKGSMSPFHQALHDELCKLGAEKCPTMLFMKEHNHMSEVFAIGTADTSVSGPILEWIRSVK